MHGARRPGCKGVPTGSFEDDATQWRAGVDQLGGEAVVISGLGVEDLEVWQRSREVGPVVPAVSPIHHRGVVKLEEPRPRRKHPLITVLAEPLLVPAPCLSQLRELERHRWCLGIEQHQVRARGEKSADHSGSDAKGRARLNPPRLTIRRQREGNLRGDQRTQARKPGNKAREFLMHRLPVLDHDLEDVTLPLNKANSEAAN
ncbi:hypothetical protein BDK51DRAFT_37749 [Blyttiomyces helicus]|uniref:Uncharacterized protein n=1 Tax=Blyttiomyces helicus TaxID=388810 RepID=A0A4P9W604_9FUNG|nr:hypothetical protein BDK51DRAFT_37749 [Blyttiomyces helicus]|eukprot:RKO86180.1 hypothetical protein BDK51DRAFT_37749 [Blyttiomyces helicus]